MRDLHRRRHLADGLQALWHLGSSQAVTPLVANHYKIGTLNISFADPSAPAPVFTPEVDDPDRSNNRIGILITQAFPASTAPMEQIVVFSETGTVVGYEGGVLKLSSGQCVTVRQRRRGR